MFNNSLVSIGLVLSMLGISILYVLYLQWKNKAKSNELNIYKYKDKKDEVFKDFYALDKHDRVSEFNDNIRKIDYSKDNDD